MLSTGRAAGTVSCAAPSTIGLTMRRSWTMSAALQEATPSRFTWFLKVISRWWPPHCTAILQNYWLFSTCKYWRWSCETISINIHSSLCDASLLSKRSGNVAPMLNFFFSDPGWTWQRDGKVLLPEPPLCRQVWGDWMETPQGSRFTRLGWRFRAHGEGAEMAMGMGVQASTRLPIPVGDSPYSKVFA